MQRGWVVHQVALVCAGALFFQTVLPVIFEADTSTDCHLTVQSDDHKTILKTHLIAPVSKKLLRSPFPLTVNINNLLHGTHDAFILFSDAQSASAHPAAPEIKFSLRHESAIITIQDGKLAVNYPETPYFRWLLTFADMPLSEAARAEVERCLKRIEHCSAEHEIMSTSDYLEWIAQIPWGITTQSQLNLTKAQQALDADHVGLEEVKENIMLYLSSLICLHSGVERITSSRTPVICLVGPPGVGKTSIAQSIARCLGRPFYALSLNGESDSHLIKGHQRTYKDAVPGAIVESVCKAGSMNPVILLDEIDKIPTTPEGSRLANTLLDLLDPVQNKGFKDHFLGFPLDLSQTVFIATANTLALIPQALQDRFELIEIAPYTIKQKVAIAQRHLIPKALKELDLAPTTTLFSHETLVELIRKYSDNGGLRTLEKNIRKLCRHYHKSLLAQIKEPTRVCAPFSTQTLAAALPILKDSIITPHDNGIIGITYGIAMTNQGARIIEISARNVGKGTAQVSLTNDCSTLCGYASQLIPNIVRQRSPHQPHCTGPVQKGGSFYSDNICLHLTESNAIDQHDASSLAAPMAIATLSALTWHSTMNSYVMCGDLDGYQRLLPVNHIKEKVVVAELVGFKQIIVPLANKAELTSMLPHLNNIEVIFAATLNHIIERVGPHCSARRLR